MSRISTTDLTVILMIFLGTPVYGQDALRPQVPISYAQWERLQIVPGALERLGAALPAVAPEPGPIPPPLPAPAAGVEPSVFSPERAPLGQWSNLANIPPGGPYNLGNPLLLTDGSVIVHRTDTRDWYRLTPDSTGSYIKGTWSQIASMQPGYGPKFFASAVLPDGRVIAVGGEYNLGGPASWVKLGSIYDPTAGTGGTWTAVAPPNGWNTIGDAQSTVLANGIFMIASCCDTTPFRAALLSASTLSWSSTGTNKADRYDEESWTLLPDGSVLTIDAYTTSINGVACGRNTERYDPATGSWSNAGNVPSQLSDCNNANTEGGSSPSFEIGPQVLMYNGKVIAFGGTTANVAHAAIYDTATHAWTAGPDLPTTCTLEKNDGTVRTNMPCTLADAPATLLPNGNVLFVASVGKFNKPVSFFEYDPNSSNYNSVPGTSDANNLSSFYVNFVALPTGQILAVETYTSTIQIYTPSGTFQTAWQPIVESALTCMVPGNSYVVTGKQLNGLSQGANYGDDQQAATNYPLVRIVNDSTGHVFYARTSGHSTMAVAPNAPASTNFKLALGTETGASKLYVVANGIPSAGKPITVAESCPQAGNEGPRPIAPASR